VVAEDGHDTVAGTDAGEDGSQARIDGVARPTNLEAIVPCHNAQVNGKSGDPHCNDLGETVDAIDVQVG
jgi:hypothetical protein